jgi:hypothetical protein
LSDTLRDRFPQIFERISGCIFFGTPFKGAPVAAIAAFLVEQAKGLGREKDYYDTCLTFMKPESEELKQLRDEFLYLAQRLEPAIQLHCVYETVGTDYASWLGLSDIKIIKNAIKCVVPKVSIFLHRRYLG